jgi:hypothetical protein
MLPNVLMTRGGSFGSRPMRFDECFGTEIYAKQPSGTRRKLLIHVIVAKVESSQYFFEYKCLQAMVSIKIRYPTPAFISPDA